MRHHRQSQKDKNEGMLRALGRFIHRLGGLFLTGIDVGTTLQDMELMRMETPYVVTVSESLGGPGNMPLPLPLAPSRAYAPASKKSTAPLYPRAAPSPSRAPVQ